MHDCLCRRAGPACNMLLDLPRVTLLFLSRAEMPHERLWANWLGSVRGLLPLTHVRVRTMLVGPGLATRWVSSGTH